MMVKMSRSFALFFAFALAVSSVTGFLSVRAEARTIVVPDDYPTITAAIGNATSGDTVFVRKGTYEEHKLTVDKTLSLVGEDTNFTVIKNLRGPLISEPYYNPPMYEVTAVQINANNVRFSGFTIMNSADSIVVNGNGNSIVGNIVLLRGDGITLGGHNNTITNNIVSGFGNVFIACSGSYNIIAGNSLNGEEGLHGIKIFGSVNVVYNNTLKNSGNGIEVEGDANTIAGNNITLSGSIQINARSKNNIIYANRAKEWTLGLMGFNNTFYANEASGIGIGGTHGGSIDAANNIFYLNNFLGDAPELRVYTKTPGPLIWDNGKEGNYWSSYRGADANNDGIGDLPYKVNAAYSYYDGAISEETIVDCGQDNFPLISPFNIDSVIIELPDWALSPTPSPEPQQPEPFPTTVVAAAAVPVAVISIGLLIYFKKHRH